MIAPGALTQPPLSPAATITASREEIAASAPERALEALYRRCRFDGGCPYSLQQLIEVLTALRYYRIARAGDVARRTGLPDSAVYGCFLELEDLSLIYWWPRPALSAGHVSAEISDTGLKLLREITAPNGAAYAR